VNIVSKPDADRRHVSGNKHVLASRHHLGD